MIVAVKRLSLIAAFALVACSSPSPAPDAPAQTTTNAQATESATPAPTTGAPATPTAAPTINLSQRCTNAQFGVTVAYPEGWHTNDGSVIPACTAFDANPVSIPPQSEIPFSLAVVLTRHEGAIADATQSTQWERVLSSEKLTVNGREAVRVEVESTGEGLADKGMRTTKYLIATGKGQALVASTHNVSDAYARNQEVLARMVEGLTFP